ncbi:putative DNA primase/helicase [Janthinobacterium sp. 78]|nr:putative DNA primase/helicase [Janthinobacterium sp. 78]
MQLKKPSTASIAKGRWLHILPALGIDPKYLTKRHGPCPMCHGKDRYRFDDLDGRGTWICTGCGSGDGFSLLKKMFGWTFAEAARQVDQVADTFQSGTIVQERTDEQKIAALRRIWESSVKVTYGDPAWLYLNRRTGIETVPDDIRFHPAMSHTEGGVYPVMLALLSYPDATIVSLHRTYLTDGGYKAPVSDVKKFLPGRLLNTAAVRTGPVAQRLGIGEGIESALAAQHRFGCTVWAATNAGLLATWVPPSGVKEVLIAGDNDASFAGQAAAYTLAQRLVRDGFAVELQIPSVTGTDWADEH